MGEKTGIQWTDHTFNPWWGCTKVSRDWRLEDVRRLAEPVDCRGAQGLWDVPDDIAAAVRERIAA